MNEGKNLTRMEETSTPEPVLLAVDDDPNTLGRIEHELRQRYGSYYRVACEGSPEAGMRTLRELRAAGEDVAVVLADQWMPGMTGVEFLTHTRPLYPARSGPSCSSGATGLPENRSFRRWPSGRSTTTCPSRSGPWTKSSTGVSHSSWKNGRGTTAPRPWRCA